MYQVCDMHAIRYEHVLIPPPLKLTTRNQQAYQMPTTIMIFNGILAPTRSHDDTLKFLFMMVCVCEHWQSVSSP
jgi:hypothetical protein